MTMSYYKAIRVWANKNTGENINSPPELMSTQYGPDVSAHWCK